MSKRLLRGMLLATVAVLLLGAAGSAQGYDIQLEIEVTDRQPIPAICATWTEIWPNPGVNHHQDGYIDTNRDLVVSFCDLIVLDLIPYHIQNVVEIGNVIIISAVRLDAIVKAPQPAPNPPPWPPICTTWHEEEPNFCADRHLDEVDDADGDGYISVCDHACYDGVWYHVESMSYDPIDGWVYVGVRVPPPSTVETVQPEPDPPTPYCTIWHETWPDYCASHHQSDYIDNGDGVISVCDHIGFDGVLYHIIGVYAEEDPGGGWRIELELAELASPVENKSWGEIKSRFQE